MIISTTGDLLDVVPGSGDPLGSNVIDLTTDQEGGKGFDVVEVQASARPTFTITDAASSCSVSRKTITRKLPELAIHGAAKDDDGVWRIPVEALLAVGLHPGRSLPVATPAAARTAAPVPIPTRDPQQDTVTIPRDRWDDVRIRLARAEAEAAERALALADARLALRALTAGPATSDRLSSSPAGQELPTTLRVGSTSPLAAPGTATATGPEGSTSPGTAATTPQGSATADAVAPAAAVIPPGAPTAGASAVAATEAQRTGTEAQAAVPADVVAARNLAARTGGYVPAGATPVKKRRWWQSR
jgi:hypothetical protein